MLSLSPAWRRTGQLWLGLLRASAGTAPSVRRDLYVSHEWSRRFSSAAATDPSHSSSASAEHVTTASGKYLSRHVRGVKRWEEAKEKATEEEIDFETFCNRIIKILEANRYTKASNLTKIYDRCTSVDELNKAEEVLKSFRGSLSRPTPALPLVLVRACLRLEQSQRALQYVSDKVQFGVFPSRRVYHILMDAFIAEGDTAGALSTFQQMQEDEVDCDENIPEGLKEAISLSRQCFQLEPKLRSKCNITIISTLLKQGRHREAEETLEAMEKDGTLLPQTHLNLLTHTLVSTGQLGRALSLLKHHLCPPSNTGQHLTDLGQLGSDLGQQASDPGQQVSDPGKQASDPGQLASDPGQLASDPGQLASDPGQLASDLGQLASDPGQLVSDPGQLASDPEQLASDPEQLASDPGQQVSDLGQLAIDPGQQASETGQLASDPGQQASDTGQQASDPGQLTSDTGQQASDLIQPSNDLALGQSSSDPGQLSSESDAEQQTSGPGQQSSDPGLGLPHMAWPELCSAIQASGNEALSQQLEELKEELKINGKIHE